MLQADPSADYGLRRRAFLAGIFTALQGGPVIDTHTHFYDPSRPQGVPWPRPQEKVLYRTVLPPEFEKLSAPYGVTKTVVIEASPWFEDNQWLLDLGAKHPVIAGVVGNLKPGTDDFAKGLTRFGKSPLFRGIRVGGADLAHTEDFRRLSEKGLSLDVLGVRDRTDTLLRLNDALPDLRIILDHLPVEGAADLSPFRGRTSIYAKVSTTLRRAGGSVAEDVEGMDRVWEAFGEDRVIYGSNWPVSDLLAPYSRVFETPRSFFAKKGRAAERKYFFENAQRAYRLKAL